MFGYYVVISVGIVDSKMKGSSLGENSLGSESRTGVDSSIGRSDGKFGSSVGSSLWNGYDKMEWYALVYKLFGS